MSIKQAGRQYIVRFSIAMAVYAVAVVVSQTIIEQLPGDNVLRYGLAILPVIPMLFGLAAFLAFLRRMDEMQQRIQLEAFALSLGITGFVTFTLGLLETVGLPSLSLIWVFPFMVAVWGISLSVATRRYR